MSDENQLTIREVSQLDLEFVHFKNNQIVFDREAKPEEMAEVLRFVRRAEGACKWWAGDALKHTYEVFGEEAARIAAREFPDPMDAWECLRTCQTIAPEDREERVDYKFHIAAIQESGGRIEDVRIWLKLGAEQGWSRPQLRAAVRAAGAEYSQDTRTKGTRTITLELHRLAVRVKEVIADRPVSEWSIDEINAFLDDAEPLAETIEDAQNRWKEINPNLPGVE